MTKAGLDYVTDNMAEELCALSDRDGCDERLDGLMNISDLEYEDDGVTRDLKYLDACRLIERHADMPTAEPDAIPYATPGEYPRP